MPILWQAQNESVLLCPRIGLYKKTFEKFLDGDKKEKLHVFKRYPSGV